MPSLQKGERFLIRIAVKSNGGFRFFYISRMKKKDRSVTVCTGITWNLRMYVPTTFACTVDAAPEAAWALIKYCDTVKRSRTKNWIRCKELLVQCVLIMVGATSAFGTRLFSSVL